MASIKPGALHLQRPNELEDITRFSKVCEQFLRPLIAHFDTAEPKGIETYRKAGGALERSNEVREKLCQVMYEAQVGFRSPWYDDRRKGAAARDAQLRTSSVRKLVSRDESENLEFKASMSLDVKRLLLGDGERAMRVGLEDEGVLRSIVAMLNSKGGEVVIGVLEEVDFASADEQRLQALLRIDDKIIIGLEPEYDKKGWDSYHRRLTELIESRIGPDVLDQELIEVARLTARDGDSGSVFDICRVVVRPSETRQYLNGELFFIRRGNKTERLKGPEIDRYWQAR